MDTSDKDIKYIDIEEFQEFGYLQEVNRQFLHPLGLALEVRREAPEEEFRSWLQEWFDAIPDCPDHIDAALVLLAEFGIKPGKMRLGGVWDYRDDPEGVNFDEVDDSKIDNIRCETGRRYAGRVQELGYWIQ